MNGFSSEWLALREPADHRAGNPRLRDAVVAAFAGRDELEIVDLGCGAGSNLRALAAHLPAGQTWRLVDNDPLLLEAARRALSAWACEVESIEPLLLRKQGRRVKVVFHETNLATFDGAVLGKADLVTAAALFDLASKEWIERFCAMLAHRRLPLYALLTYDGNERWSPPCFADEAMLHAFHWHQARDKGFGAALGPQASGALQRALQARSYEVATAASPWRLNAPQEADLIAALAEGAAAAVAQTALVPATTVEEWRRARRAALSVEIGHVDLFARLPAAIAHGAPAASAR